MSEISISDVGRMFGLALPDGPGKCKCPIRKHKRTDKTFRVFRAQDGTLMWKCWSCDEPMNRGDAVALYAAMSGTDRRDAWKRLRDDGFEVPGARHMQLARATSRPAAVMVPPRCDIPLSGTTRGPALRLDQRQVDAWASLEAEHVDKFLRDRGLAPDFDRHGFGVIPMPHEAVGFVYFDPATGDPCRVKVRSVEGKRFYCEPRPDPERPGAKASAPLYLADRLDVSCDYVVIVEGEIDALSLASVGMRNVVSLPDGSESAGTVSLQPLVPYFRRWLVATDDDEPGDKAWRKLLERANAAGVDAARIKWAWFEDDELRSFKDANDALRAGFGYEDFADCCDVVRPDTVRRVA